jgi:sigma-B regulation protein RsbU (phosphoserine phosphatase)
VSPVEELVRERLQAKRKTLADAAAVRQEESLVELLRRVDEALSHLEIGDWGLCAVCHEAMDTGRLSSDPLVSVCLECLSAEERTALERDLESAARVQRALLPPRELVHDGWEVAWLWEPRGAVSGDHVDLLAPRSDGDPVHLLLGDVVGKGVAASFLQSHLHALFRALTTPEMNLGELLVRANRLFAEATAGASYATLIGARLRPDGIAELANAGHPRPLVADRRGVRPVEGSGLPLGLFAEAEYGSREIRLGTGDVLLLYTDGWTEAAQGEEEFGIGRAAAALRQAAAHPLPELLATCRGEMERFLDGTRRGDDLTLLAVRRTT